MDFGVHVGPTAPPALPRRPPPFPWHAPTARPTTPTPTSTARRRARANPLRYRISLRLLHRREFDERQPLATIRHGDGTPAPDERMVTRIPPASVDTLAARAVWRESVEHSSRSAAAAPALTYRGHG